MPKHSLGSPAGCCGPNWAVGWSPLAVMMGRISGAWVVVLTNSRCVAAPQIAQVQ
jgi:hypothetical protein